MRSFHFLSAHKNPQKGGCLSRLERSRHALSLSTPSLPSQWLSTITTTQKPARRDVCWPGRERLRLSGETLRRSVAEDAAAAAGMYNKIAHAVHRRADGRVRGWAGEMCVMREGRIFRRRRQTTTTTMTTGGFFITRTRFRLCIPGDLCCYPVVPWVMISITVGGLDWIGLDWIGVMRTQQDKEPQAQAPHNDRLRIQTAFSLYRTSSSHSSPLSIDVVTPRTTHPGGGS
jgi:hypothetical protein